MVNDEKQGKSQNILEKRDQALVHHDIINISTTTMGKQVYMWRPHSLQSLQEMGEWKLNTANFLLLHCVAQLSGIMSQYLRRIGYRMRQKLLGYLPVVLHNCNMIPMLWDPHCTHPTLSRPTNPYVISHLCNAILLRHQVLCHIKKIFPYRDVTCKTLYAQTNRLTFCPTTKRRLYYAVYLLCHIQYF
jgi:hypothetical protein